MFKHIGGKRGKLGERVGERTKTFKTAFLYIISYFFLFISSLGELGERKKIKKKLKKKLK